MDLYKGLKMVIRKLSQRAIPPLFPQKKSENRKAAEFRYVFYAHGSQTARKRSAIFQTTEMMDLSVFQNARSAIAPHIRKTPLVRCPELETLLQSKSLMVAGAAIEVGSLGTLTVAVAFEEAAAVALVADGFGRTMRNRDISLDRNKPPTTWKNSDLYAPDKPLPRDPKQVIRSQKPTRLILN